MGTEEDNPFEVLLSDAAKFSYMRIGSAKDRRRVDKVLDVLDTVPEIGRLYDPVYEAVKPPIDLRVVYAGPYGIYYEVSDKHSAVFVYHIEDQRRDPRARFGLCV